MTNIIVAFPKQDTARNIKKILMQNGHHVDAVCTTGAQALQNANELDGGVMVCGYRFADMMYTELHEYLPLSLKCCSWHHRETVVSVMLKIWSVYRRR